MAIVTKTINGHAYQYEQISYREAGKVKSRMRYIGPVCPIYGKTGVAAATSARGEAEAATLSLLQRGRILEALEARSEPTRSAPSIPVSNDSASEVNPTPEDHFYGFVASKVDVQSYGISEARIHRTELKVCEQLEARGIDPSEIPTTIIIQPGEAITVRKSKLFDRIVVTIPNRPNKKQFHEAIAQAHGRLAFEALRQQHPARYADLTLRFKKSFQTSQRLLVDYMKYSKDRNRFYKALSLIYWGRVDHMAKSFGKDPANLGLPSLARRKDWQSEVASLYGAIATKGWKQFRDDHIAKVRRAEGHLSAARTAYSTIPRLDIHKRKRTRRRIKQCEARCQQLEEVTRKSYLIRDELF